MIQSDRDFSHGFHREPFSDQMLIWIPEDWTTEEWNLICRLFGLPEQTTQRIVLKDLPTLEYFISEKLPSYRSLSSFEVIDIDYDIEMIGITGETMEGMKRGELPKDVFDKLDEERTSIYGFRFLIFNTRSEYYPDFFAVKSIGADDPYFPVSYFKTITMPAGSYLKTQSDDLETLTRDAVHQGYLIDKLYVYYKEYLEDWRPTETYIRIMK